MSMWNVGERRAAVSLVEFSDTACFLPCRDCSELVQEDDRFCRFCGADQLDNDGNGDARPGDGPASAASAAQSPAAVDLADTVQPAVPAVPAALALYAPTNAANEAEKPEAALDRPNAFGLRRLLEGSAPGSRVGSSVIALRLALGVVSLGVLLALILGRHLDLDTLGATAEQPIRSARVGNERGSADLALGVVNAGERWDAQGQRRVPDAQLLPAGTPPDQRRDAASDVAIALGLGESAAPAAAAVSAPMAADPAPEVSVSEPKQDECGEALAALSMCPKP